MFYKPQICSSNGNPSTVWDDTHPTVIGSLPFLIIRALRPLILFIVTIIFLYNSPTISPCKDFPDLIVTFESTRYSIGLVGVGRLCDSGF